MFEKNKKQHKKSRVYYMMKEQGFTSTVKNLLILQNRNRPRAISDFWYKSFYYHVKESKINKESWYLQFTYQMKHASQLVDIFLNSKL